jgi:hypothetical protein
VKKKNIRVAYEPLEYHIRLSLKDLSIKDSKRIAEMLEKKLSIDFPQILIDELCNINREENKDIKMSVNMLNGSAFKLLYFGFVKNKLPKDKNV